MNNPTGLFLPNTAAGTLTISGVSMHTYGWNVLDVRDLWLVVAQRGQDRLIPGVEGMRAYRRRRTVTPHSLPMVIGGLYTPAGAPVTDPTAQMAQLQSNIDYLMDNVVAPVNTIAGTRSATLTMPNGGTRSAQIHVLGITPGQWVVPIVRATLDISIPGSKFT